MKKLLLLFTGLFLPVLVFIFLKFFGRNEFDVPPLHQEKIEVTKGNCNINYAVPYVVPDSILRRLGGAEQHELLAVSMALDEKHLRQVVSIYSEVAFVGNTEFSGVEQSGWIKDCILLVPENSSVVLLDKAGKVRGYYDASDREELDRLEAEIKIILKKYEQL